jgi:hypothetical protein
LSAGLKRQRQADQAADTVPPHEQMAVLGGGLKMLDGRIELTSLELDVAHSEGTQVK